jgi:hypothetical protein
LGLYVVYRAYLIQNAPHEFVMLIFSGTLMVLLGVTGLIGLIHGYLKTQAPSDRESETDLEGDEGGLDYGEDLFDSSELSETEPPDGPPQGPSTEPPKEN